MLELRHRRGFTMLDLIAALVIVAILALIAVPSYLAVHRRADRNLTATSLSAVAVQSRQFAAENHYLYPGDLLTRLSTFNPVWGSGASNGTDHVSVAVSGTQTLVAAVRTDDGYCAMLADDLRGDTFSWAYDPAATSCDAAVAMSHVAEITGTSPAGAPEISID